MGIWRHSWRPLKKSPESKNSGIKKLKMKMKAKRRLRWRRIMKKKRKTWKRMRDGRGSDTKWNGNQTFLTHILLFKMKRKKKKEKNDRVALLLFIGNLHTNYYLYMLFKWMNQHLRAQSRHSALLTIQMNK